MTSVTRIRSTIGITAALTLAWTGGAAADVEQAWWNHDLDFGYELSHMPDFDQRRQITVDVNGLPGHGETYCVPTSVMNLLAYIGSHGFPEVPPGGGIWQLDANYDAITLQLTLLGALMGTNLTGGTNGLGRHNGTRSWLGQYPDFAVYTYWGRIRTWCPTLADISLKAAQGHLVEFAYGRYVEIPLNGPPQYVRGGGHAVTLTGSVRNGSYQQVSYRDPADDPRNTTQSPFGNRYFELADATMVVEVDGVDYVRDVSELLTNSGDDLRRIIDQTTSIRLRDGLSYAPGANVVHLIRPLGLDGSSASDALHALDPDLAIIAAHADPGTGRILMAVDDTGGPSQLVALNPLSGATTLIRNLNVPVLENPLDMVQGRKRELYVLTDHSIACLDPDLEGAIRASTFLTGTAITFDDVGDRVIWIHAGIRQLWQMSEGLDGGGVAFVNIPTWVPLGIDARIAVTPEGRVWMVTPGVETMTGILVDDGTDIEQIDLAGVQNPTSVSTDEHGDLYVVCDAGVRRMRRTGGVWGIVPSAFDDAATAAVLEVARSRTNWDPDQHGLEGWTNAVDPDEIVRNDEFDADCPGDADYDGDVDLDDLLRVLVRWGSTDGGGADTNLDGVVDLQDLLTVLVHWGASC